MEKRCFIVKIKQKTIDERGSVYEAARKYWAAAIERAMQAEYVLAVLAGSQGKVIGVYKPDTWYDVTGEYAAYQHKHGRPVSSRSKRIAFSGGEAEAAVKAQYKGKCLPGYLWRPQAPFRYTY
jgi:hypothetical protein